MTASIAVSFPQQKQICCHARNTLDSKGVGEKKDDGSSTRSVLTSFHVGRIIYTDIRQSGHRPATSSGYWIGTRTRPIPIFLASRSGYLRRAFSANFLVLNGFDKMTSSRPWYSNSIHRTNDFISIFYRTKVMLTYCPCPAIGRERDLVFPQNLEQSWIAHGNDFRFHQ